MGFDSIEGMALWHGHQFLANLLDRYWDVRQNAADYSFVDYAISRGYSVFFYDRLGTGKSTK